MLNMIFADIYGFMYPGFLQGIMTGYAEGLEITGNLLLIAAVMTEIPIVMVLLSRVLSHPINRWVNIMASVITIVFVIGGGSTKPHYLFFASIEVACMLFIIWYAWTWRKHEQQFKSS